MGKQEFEDLSKTPPRTSLKTDENFNMIASSPAV